MDDITDQTREAFKRYTDAQDANRPGLPGYNPQLDVLPAPDMLRPGPDDQSLRDTAPSWVGNINDKGIGVADFVPGAQTAMAWSDLQKLNAQQDYGFEVSPWQKLGASANVALSVLPAGGLMAKGARKVGGLVEDTIKAFKPVVGADISQLPASSIMADWNKVSPVMSKDAVTGVVKAGADNVPMTPFLQKLQDTGKAVFSVDEVRNLAKNASITKPEKDAILTTLDFAFTPDAKITVAQLSDAMQPAIEAPVPHGKAPPKGADYDHYGVESLYTKEVPPGNEYDHLPDMGDEEIFYGPNDANPTPVFSGHDFYSPEAEQIYNSARTVVYTNPLYAPLQVSQHFDNPDYFAHVRLGNAPNGDEFVFELQKDMRVNPLMPEERINQHAITDHALQTQIQALHDDARHFMTESAEYALFTPQQQADYRQTINSRIRQLQIQIAINHEEALRLAVEQARIPLETRTAENVDKIKNYRDKTSILDAASKNTWYKAIVLDLVRNAKPGTTLHLPTLATADKVEGWSLPIIGHDTFASDVAKGPLGNGLARDGWSSEITISAIKTLRPIIDFYKTELPTFATKELGAQLVTDPYNNTWWGIKITPETQRIARRLFTTTATVGTGTAGIMATQQNKAGAQTLEQPDFTNKYNTQLTPEEEQQYQIWADRQKAGIGRDVRNDNFDYDTRGLWKKLGGADLQPGHGTDEFKKPNHPTFSTDSNYNGVDGHVGGQWLELHPPVRNNEPFNPSAEQQNGKDVFVPSKTNLQNLGPDGLKKYFKDREPNVELRLPPTPVMTPDNSPTRYMQGADGVIIDTKYDTVVTDPRSIITNFVNGKPTPDLLDAMATIESSGKKNALSPKGATGRMQIMPKEAANPGYGIKPYNPKIPDDDMRYAGDYIAAMYKKYGNINYALMAYNWGPNALDRWIARGRDPYAIPTETKDYAFKVMQTLENQLDAKYNKLSQQTKGALNVREYP